MTTRSAFTALVLLASVCVVGCDSKKTAQPSPHAGAEAVPVKASASAAAPSATASALLPQREIAGAAQVLVSYKGAELASKGVTRTKEEAKKRAEEALKKIKEEKMPFEKAAEQYSDDEASKKIGGALGNFEKNAMPEAFSKATFAMKVGDISDVVETPRGFHIIKRTR